MKTKNIKCEHCLFQTMFETKLNQHLNIYHSDSNYILCFF